MWGIFGTHRRLWLNNETGWVCEADATRYTYEQKQNMPLPFGGVWQRLEAIKSKQPGFKK